MDDTFIFLRTKLPLEHTDSIAFEKIAYTFPFDFSRPDWTPKHLINDPFLVPVLGFGDDCATWTNGLVFRFPSHQPPSDIAVRMKVALVEFDAWAIVNDDRQFVENPSGGLFSRFFMILKTSAVSHI